MTFASGADGYAATSTTTHNGDGSELVARGGRYAMLFELQASGYR